MPDPGEYKILFGGLKRSGKFWAGMKYSTLPEILFKPENNPFICNQLITTKMNVKINIQ
jgi:hypothetical protein